MSDPNKTPERQPSQTPTNPFVPPTPITPLPSSSILSSFSTPQQLSDRLAKLDAKRAQLIGKISENENIETKELDTIEESTHESNIENSYENDQQEYQQQHQDTNQQSENQNPNDNDFDLMKRQFDFHMIQTQNEKHALKAQLQALQVQLAQFQYEQSFHRFHGPQPDNKFDIAKNVSKPESFNGDFKFDPDTWIASMRSYLMLIGAPMAAQAHIAGTYLKNTAAQWYNTLSITDRSKLVDFESFAVMFLSRFRPLDVVGQARRKLVKLTQTGSVDTFNQQFMQLMQLIPTMNEEERIESYRSKLKFELKKQLITQEYYRLSDIMNVALRTDALLYEHSFVSQRPNQFRNRPFFGKYRNEQSVPTPTPVAVNNVKIDPYEQHNENENALPNQQVPFNYVAPRPMDEKERQRCRDNRLCFRCRQPGHRSADCTVFTSSNQRPGLKPSADISQKKY
jgi:type II secretory pathway pseudopilin PulG